jgi:hypothetical protein
MARVEIEPATLGSQGKYSTSRPPRPIIMDNLSFGTNLELVTIRNKKPLSERAELKPSDAS